MNNKIFDFSVKISRASASFFFIFVGMRYEYSNEFGSVWLVNDDIYVLEKYYNDIESLFRDESYVLEEITDMDFFVYKKTISTVENKRYLLMSDWRGYKEPNGPEWTWVLKYDLEYLGE